MASRWQLINRPAEFNTIRAALTGLESMGVVLVGAVGVGKTTLARAVTTSLAQPVRWVAGTKTSRNIPLGAVASWLHPSASRNQVELMAAARESLVAENNTILAVDDAHLLDQLSATLIHQIAADHAGRILATVRSGEPTPDAVTALWKDGYAQRLELAPFSKEQTIVLVEAALGGAIEGFSLDLMWDASDGNPLFLRHLIEGSLDAGTLTELDGVWQLRGPTAVPAGLAELLQERLDDVGGDVLGVLKLLALCEPLDIGTACELAGEEGVDAAELRGLIRVTHDGADINCWFNHPFFADVVRRRIGTASARKLRGSIARALRSRELDSPASRIRLAHLCIDSDEDCDVELLVAAAKDAMSLSNLPLAERIARAAYECSSGVPEAELLSRALLWQGHPVQADAILNRFEPEELDELQLLQWGIPHLSILFWSMGDIARANQVLELLQRRVVHPALKLLVEACGSAMAVHQNMIAEGIAAAERVLASPHAPRQAIDWAAFAAGLAMPVAGRGYDFEPIAARCRAERKPTEGMIRVMLRYCDVLALTTVGELDLADRRVAEYAEFAATGQRLAWAIRNIMTGLVAVYRGKFPDAISVLEQAVAAQAAEVAMPWRLPARILLAKAYAALGRTDQVERVFTEAKEHAGPHLALHSPQLMIAKSWHVAADGLERDAIELAKAAADVARQTGQFAVEAEALHHAARFGDHTVAQRLAALAEQVQGRMVTLQARHAAAVAADDGPALDEVSAAFEDAGLLFSAADAAAQAAPPHRQAGRRGESVESAARAQRLAIRCGGVTTPAIRSAARPLPVTAREREIATLVAAGLSNREIAERLMMSVRTVEGHVYRACLKLDVANRDELARLMREELSAG